MQLGRTGCTGKRRKALTGALLAVATGCSLWLATPALAIDAEAALEVGTKVSAVDNDDVTTPMEATASTEGEEAVETSTPSSEPGEDGVAAEASSEGTAADETVEPTEAATTPETPAEEGSEPTVENSPASEGSEESLPEQTDPQPADEGQGTTTPTPTEEAPSGAEGDKDQPTDPTVLGPAKATQQNKQDEATASETTTISPAPRAAKAAGFTGIRQENGSFYYYRNGKRVTTPGVYLIDGKHYVIVNTAGVILSPKKSGVSWAYRNYRGRRYLLYRNKANGAYYVKFGYAKKRGVPSYTRPDTGSLVRKGAYVTSNKRRARIIIANKNGRLATLPNGARRGWVTSSSWGFENKRYYLYRYTSGPNAGMYIARLGYSGHGYPHITTADGYVRTENLSTGGRVYVINASGRVAAPKNGGNSGWLTSRDYVPGKQRYHLTKDTSGLYQGAYYAVPGLRSKKATGTYDHFTSASGNVVRNAVIVVGGTAYRANSKGRLTKLDASNLRGVDIFSGNGDAGINIAKLAADFVIVKATQGTKYTNPYYKRHADAVLKAGKLLGFYHYASTDCGGGSAIQQADYFVKTVGSAYIGKAVLALDWENNVGENKNFGKGATSVAWCKQFLDRVYQKTGVRPLIYMSRSVAQGSNWSSVANSGYELWMAQYLYRYYKGDGKPNVDYQTDPVISPSTGFGAWKKPTIYQYTPEGRDRNYSGALDFNTFYGLRRDWNRLASKVK